MRVTIFPQSWPCGKNAGKCHKMKLANHQNPHKVRESARNFSNGLCGKNMMSRFENFSKAREKMLFWEINHNDVMYWKVRTSKPIICKCPNKNIGLVWMYLPYHCGEWHCEHFPNYPSFFTRAKNWSQNKGKLQFMLYHPTRFSVKFPSPKLSLKSDLFYEMFILAETRCLSVERIHRLYPHTLRYPPTNIPRVICPFSAGPPPTVPSPHERVFIGLFFIYFILL